MKEKDEKIWFEMARRKVQFHRDKIWNKIELWGLFHWGEVSHLLKTGELETSMKKENKIIWVRPSREAYTKYIKPLLKYDINVLQESVGWK